MKKFLKWLGIVLGALLGLIVIVLVVVYFKGSTALSRAHDVVPESVTIPTDAASMARGKALSTSRQTDSRNAPSSTAATASSRKACTSIRRASRS